jgi:hypothetical protein
MRSFIILLFNVMRVIKSRMRWAEHVAPMEIGSESRRPLGKSTWRWEDIT